MFEGTSKAAGGDTNMVLGNNLPLLRAYKLRSWGSFGQLHRIHYPIFSTYAHLQKSLCQTGKKKKKKRSLFFASPLARAALLALALFPFGQAVCFRYLFWWASCNYLDQLSGHSGLMGIPSHIPQLQCPLKREKERGCCKCTKAFKFWIWKYYEKN